MNAGRNNVPPWEPIGVPSDPIDPVRATSAAFNRRVFVGLGAGAAAALSSVGAAHGQAGAEAGTHPPFVAPHDATIETQQLALDRPDVALDAYAAWPKSAGATTPGIVMVQHIWGVDAVLRDVVRRYAKQGYLCIAPDLYARSHPPSGDGSSQVDLFRPAAAALDDAVVQADLLAARRWIVSQAAQAKIGITGFCMGGGFALKALIGTTDYAAASIFYGDVRPGTARSAATSDRTFDYTAQISTPLRGNYGERDTSIAAGDVRTMFSRLRAPHDLSVYPQAGHAFFDDTRASYVATAAADAWIKTLAWFQMYLG